LGQGVHRAGLVTAGGQRQRLQGLDLDDAARAALACRRRVQPLQQSERLVGAVLGEQHPREHEILRLPGVARLIVGAEATLLCSAGGRGDVTLGQQQPRPLRRDGVEQAGHRRARCGPLGLAHRLQCPCGLTFGLPDPRQRRQAGG
jgi:hypothetical protein